MSSIPRAYTGACWKSMSRERVQRGGREGISLRQIAEEIATGLKVSVISLSPEDASSHFGWLAMFAGMDLPASSLRTQQR